ncbi:MAG: dTDP-4-dehydrorhamnose reductase [Acidobacteriota bacterium]|nr:dTDP-4-dehydrorhamnose reductase [Acidobacteriota bacterium]
MKVLVVGAAGQLGQALVAKFAGEHDVTPAARREVDLSDHRALRAFVMDRKPAAVINCAAYTNVDAAEDEQELALDVNAFAVRTLARATTELDAVLVHYSTDFVFSGTATSPYTEDDLPEPQSVYAQSKLLGEWIAADNPRHYVLRVESLFGGPKARSSVDKIADAVRAGQQAPVFADRIVSPSFADDVVAATGHLLRSGAPAGLYHCVNTGFGTWLDVGREIARLLDRPETTLKPVSVRDVKLRAPRPRYAALSNAKLARAGYAMPSWQDALQRYLSRRRAS